MHNYSIYGKYFQSIDALALLRENLIVLHANKKGADQILHLHSLICYFVLLFSGKDDR